jgi:hypothetical protein
VEVSSRSGCNISSTHLWQKKKNERAKPQSCDIIICLDLGEKIAVIDGLFDALSERSKLTVKFTLRGSEKKFSRQRRTRSAVEKPKRKEVLRLAPKSLAVNFHGVMPMASDTLDHFTIGQTLGHSMIGTSGVEEHVMSTTYSTSLDRSWDMHMAPRSQVYEGYLVDDAI